MEDEKKPTEKVEEVEAEAKKVEEAETEKTEAKPKEKVKEDVKPEEKKSGEEEEAKVNIDELKNELAEAQEKAKQVEALTEQVATLSAEAKVSEDKVKQYEEMLNKMIDTKMAIVPEDYKELVPENMDIIQSLNWLSKAEAKGIFNKKEEKKPNIEVGKPMAVEKAKADISKLKGSSLLRMAYQSKR